MPSNDAMFYRLRGFRESLDDIYREWNHDKIGTDELYRLTQKLAAEFVTPTPSQPSDVALTAELTAARAENERLRGEVERWKLVAFSPLGDNHHNAKMCPYCNPAPLLSGTIPASLSPVPLEGNKDAEHLN